MTVRVGVVGAGNIGTSHARNLARVVSGSQVSVGQPPSLNFCQASLKPFGVRTTPSPT